MKAHISEAKLEALRECLVNSDTMRDFLKESFQILGEGRKSFSYSQLSLLAGFKARSYGRALILGLKPLSLKAFVQLTQLFEFDKEHEEYFKLLVAIDQPGFGDLNLSAEQLRHKKAALYKKIIRYRNISSRPEAETIFSSREHLIIYTSVSPSTLGTSFKDICRVSGFDEKKCRSILDDLCNRGILRKLFKNDAYQAEESLLIAQKLGGKEFFHSVWLEGARVMIDQARAGMADRRKLFISSYLMIPEDRILDFRDELQVLLEKFVDKWCEEPGDKVVELIVGAAPLDST